MRKLKVPYVFGGFKPGFIPPFDWYDDSVALAVIEEARAGNLDAHRALGADARIFIDNGRPLPKHLGDYIVFALNDRADVPKNGRRVTAIKIMSFTKR